ncbi:YcbK family protein [Desulfosarcina sp.]|uniref:YcbK family protein n=1 Tax=Desulfosarcina sp. TaxID=2027861 RepID=UPI00356331C1
MSHRSRRDFIKIGAGFLATCLLPSAGWSALSPDNSRRTLSFYNAHTGEELSTCYFKNGAYCPDAMGRINHILRDHYTGDIEKMDPQLMDLLHSVNRLVECSAPFHILSAYRSPQTNDRLRKQRPGVAKSSYHILGRAIDIRLPGCDTRKLRKACLDLKLGGVGYYPRSDFVHVDTGGFRTWRG